MLEPAEDLREAAVNACKHGQGTVRVRLSAEPEGALLEVENRAGGHDTAAGVNAGRGLINVRQRAEELGGQASFEEGDSVTLRVSIPLAGA